MYYFLLVLVAPHFDCYYSFFDVFCIAETDANGQEGC
jgi:hypothetical protein